MNDSFFELIRVAIGNKVCLSRVPSAAEWKALYSLSVKQAVAGVCFCGVQRLKKSGYDIPTDLYMKWLGMAAKIQQRNELMNRRCVEVQRMLAEEGFMSAILKGQGVARLYDFNDNVNLNLNDKLNDKLGAYRQSGDIDIWVDGERGQVIDFMKRKGWKVGRTVVHHTDVEIFRDVSVEVHHFPSYSVSPCRWRKYR